MRKIAGTFLVLVLAAPAVAVTLSVADMGAGTIRLTYDVPTGEVLRGIALRLTTTSGDAAISGTDSVTAIDSFFNVFPDYAYDNPIGFTITPRMGHPLADPAGGELTTFPAADFVICMGALDETGNQGGVTGTGILCEIQYDMTGPAAICINADTVRGGAVAGDNVTQPGLPICTTPPPQCSASKPTVIKTTAAPAIATHVNAGRTETFVAAAVSSQGHALEYQFTWGDGNVSAWGSATQTHVYTYTAATFYNVTVTARCVVDGAMSPVSDPLVLSSEPVSSAAPFYATWADWNRPNCWAFLRNCRGDTNNLATGLGVNRQWINSADLILLAAGFNKIEAALAAVPNGICADFNRLATGLGANRQRVNSADLTILAGYFNKTEANVPLCPPTNFLYWTTSF